MKLIKDNFTEYANASTFSGIKREEDKIKRSLKDAAKKGHRDVCNTLAKEIVRSRKAVNKIHTAKAQIKSVEYGMQQQLGE